MDFDTIHKIIWKQNFHDEGDAIKVCYKSLGIYAYYTKDEIAFVCSLGILPEFRKQGYGKELIEHLLKIPYTIALNAKQDVLGFYLKHNFQIITITGDNHLLVFRK